MLIVKSQRQIFHIYYVGSIQDQISVLCVCLCVCMCMASMCFSRIGVFMDACESRCVWTSDCMHVLFAQPASRINFLWHTIDWSWCYLSLISVVLSSVWTILYVLSLIELVAWSKVTSRLCGEPKSVSCSDIFCLIFSPKCNWAAQSIEKKKKKKTPFLHSPIFFFVGNYTP